MHQLRFLLIQNVRVDITGSFEHVFGKLRWLSWEYCPLKSLPTNFHPRELVVLELRWSQIEKLWKGVKHLNNLKILDLSNSWSLVETPNFTGVQNLERLMLRGCESLSTIDPSICELRSLEELNLEWCIALKRLPEGLGNTKSLKTLNVCGTSLDGLPDSIGQLSRMVHLRLEQCEELKTLPTTICNLISLEQLYVRRCSKLKRLPKELGNLKCLLDLDLSGCSNLKRLPEGMGNLKSLKTLNVSETGLKELPDSIGHLSSLVQLGLSYCKKLKTLPDCIRDLSSLKVLNIHYCTRLQQLPDGLGNMVSLRYLLASHTRCQQRSTVILENLKKLKSVSLLYRGPQFRAFKRFVVPSNSSLKILVLIDCGLHDEDIPDDIGIRLLSLQCLDLRLNHFRNLPSTLCLLSNLKELHLSWCESLVSLPELPPNLHMLIASGCTAMKNIPNLSNLKRLRYLDLSESNRLVEVQGLENLKLNLLDMAACNDLAMDTTFNESFFQRCFERPYCICLPKMNFPNWIIYQSMESTISFELPRSLPHNFQGIILWVVYACESDVLSTHRAHITNNTSGLKNSNQECFFSRYLNMEHYLNMEGSWVSHIKSNFRNGDSITISISEDINGKVEKCGVHWLIGSEGDEDENVHDGDGLDSDGDGDGGDGVDCHHYDGYYSCDCYGDHDHQIYRYLDVRHGDGDDSEDDSDGDGEEEETKRDINLKRGHDFDLNTEPNEETERVYVVNFHDFDLNTEPNEESSKRLRS